MHTGSLFAHGKAGSDGKRQANRLDEEGPRAQESLHDKARNDAFDLRDARSSGVCGIFFDQKRCDECEQYLFSVSFQYRREAKDLQYREDNVEKVIDRSE